MSDSEIIGGSIRRTLAFSKFSQQLGQNSASLEIFEPHVGQNI